MFIECEFPVGLEDVNNKLEITDRFLLQCMENIGSFHADKIGRGLSYLYSQELAWAILDWNAEIIKRPVYGQNIHLKTWSKTCTKVFAYRDFYVYADNELVAKGTSKWFLINLKKRFPERIPNEFIDLYGIEANESALSIESLEKITIPEEYDREIKYKVMKRDLDTSGHVHNLNYLNMILESFPDNEDGSPLSPSFKSIRISFQKEVRYGDTILIRKLTQDNITYGKIISEDEKTVHATMILTQ